MFDSEEATWKRLARTAFCMAFKLFPHSTRWPFAVKITNMSIFLGVILNRIFCSGFFHIATTSTIPDYWLNVNIFPIIHRNSHNAPVQRSIPAALPSTIFAMSKFVHYSVWWNRRSSSIASDISFATVSVAVTRFLTTLL